MSAHLSPLIKLFLAQPAPGQALFIAGLKRAPSEADRKRIEQTGCMLRNTVGTIATLAGDQESLARLIEWEGVRSIEMSAPLYPEDSTGN
jgi:hypothetical protein